MLLKIIAKIFGTSNDRALKVLQKDVEAINALEAKYEALSDDELKEQTNVLRERLKNGESEDDILYDGFAVVREAAKRVLGQRHYDVQLIGGLCMHQGKIAEMKTGEGKTLVSTLPTYLNALSGKGVHVITVNDYLAERDSEWMGQVHKFLGLTVGCITNATNEKDRKSAYNADITYGTNNEFGFDYLRDNMKFSIEEMVQRDFNFAIIDEVDSILIDEARTPLIISGPSDTSTELYPKIDTIIPFLKAEDYEMDEKHKTIMLTDQGNEHVEELLREHGFLEDGTMYDVHNIALVHHVNQALRAHKLFEKDKDYIVKDSKVILIDEFTGRMMEGRRLSEGLHQAIEAKEGADIQLENQTLASITFQNYFRLYPKLAGMTGTAMTEAAEFHEIYKLGVLSIPTHVPVARIDHEDKIFRSLEDKYDAIIELVRECTEHKQPVLIGTVSIEKSESLSDALKKAGLKHKVLNARYHEQEAYIVAQAGSPGAVTIATNMAGRGTDIKLGGNPEMVEGSGFKPSEEDQKAVHEAGGLFVIGTERHESRRIDNQLRGRSGRQGDPGASIFFLSVEDDLMRIFGNAGDMLENMLNNSKIGLQKGEALEHPFLSKLLKRAQGKVEGMHFEVRKNLLKYDDVMNDQRKMIYEQRREIMESDNLEELVKDMRIQVVEDMVPAYIPAQSYAEKWNLDGLETEVQRVFNTEPDIKKWAEEEGIGNNEMLERLIDATDRRMAEKVANYGAKTWRQVEKSVVLQLLDQSWKEHLLNLDHLRQGINLRAFGQKDPLNEYKTEAFAMFELLLNSLRENVVQTLSMIEIGNPKDQEGMLYPEQPFDASEMEESRMDPALAGAQDPMAAMAQDGNNVREMPKKAETVRNVMDPNDPATWTKVPRNAPCPCGSGKKYKHCHGQVNQFASMNS